MNSAPIADFICCDLGGSPATIALTNCTVADNGGGAAVLVADHGGAATVTSKNTIFANNGGTTFASAGAGAQIISQGNNLDSGSGDGFLTSVGDLVNTEPLLATLSNYGGSTPTLYPKRGSPAIDAGNDSGAPATDQRGVSRPQGAHVDIGAVEANGELIFQDGFDG